MLLFSAVSHDIVTNYLKQHHHKCVRMAMHLMDDGAMYACQNHRQAAPNLGLLRRVAVFPW